MFCDHCRIGEPLQSNIPSPYTCLFEIHIPHALLTKAFTVPIITAFLECEDKELVRVIGFYRVGAFVAPLQLKVGSVITITDDRFGLSSGTKAVVTGIIEYLLDNKLELELWA